MIVKILSHFRFRATGSGGHLCIRRSNAEILHFLPNFIFMPLPIPLSDEAIVYQLKAQTNPALIAELVERHQAYVIRKCHRYVKDYEAAQDLSQEVLLRVVTMIHTFEGRSTFSTWLHTIIKRRCMDHLRENKKKMHQELSEQIIETLAEEWDDDESEKLTTAQLEAWMEEISGEDKWLLTLKYQQGLSVKEIQKIVNLSEAVINTRIHRAKMKLRRMMRERYRG